MDKQAVLREIAQETYLKMEHANKTYPRHWLGDMFIQREHAIGYMRMQAVIGARERSD